MRVHPYVSLCAASIIIAAGVSTSARAEIVYGVTSNSTLITWDSATPGTLLSGVAIQGLQSNEQVRGIDFRPATGEMFALGSFSRLYTINPLSGVATQVGPGPFANTLNGSQFGFDFNPTIDRIRVVSNADQNLVLNPNTGASTPATALFYGPADVNVGMDPDVVHSAYTNSFNGATTTQLYGLDTGLDILVTQANSAGTLGTVGPVGTDLTSVGGFDISGTTGIAYAAIMDVNLSRSTFWTINLATGAGSMVGQIDGGVVITAMTVAPGIPAPTAGAAALLGLGMLSSRRRRR